MSSQTTSSLADAYAEFINSSANRGSIQTTETGRDICVRIEKLPPGQIDAFQATLEGKGSRETIGFPDCQSMGNWLNHYLGQH